MPEINVIKGGSEAERAKHVGFFCLTTEVKSLYLHTPLAVISTLEPNIFLSGGCGIFSSSHSSKPVKKTWAKSHFWHLFSFNWSKHLAESENSQEISYCIFLFISYDCVLLLLACICWRLCVERLEWEKPWRSAGKYSFTCLCPRLDWYFILQIGKKTKTQTSNIHGS